MRTRCARSGCSRARSRSPTRRGSASHPRPRAAPRPRDRRASSARRARSCAADARRGAPRPAAPTAWATGRASASTASTRSRRACSRRPSPRRRSRPTRPRRSASWARRANERLPTAARFVPRSREQTAANGRRRCESRGLVVVRESSVTCVAHRLLRQIHSLEKVALLARERISKGFPRAEIFLFAHPTSTRPDGQVRVDAARRRRRSHRVRTPPPERHSLVRVFGGASNDFNVLIFSLNLL